MSEDNSEKKTANRMKTMVSFSITGRRAIRAAVQKWLLKQGKTYGTKPMISRFYDEAAEEKLQREKEAVERKRSA